MGRYVGPPYRGARRGPGRAAAVPLSPSGRPRHHRPPRRRGEARHLELHRGLGWLFWSLIHIYFLVEVRDRFVVAFTWLWDYVTYQRGARLITEVPPQE